MTETTAPGLPVQRAAVDLTEDAVVSFHEAWQAVITAFPQHTYASAGGCVVGRTGLPAASFNGVWGRARDVSAPAVLAAVDELAAGSLPWSVELRPGYPVELDDALAERGLVVTGDVPLMVLADPGRLANVVAAAAGDLRPVVTFNDLAAAVELMQEGFGMPAELARDAMPMRMLLMPQATVWLASVDGVPVSTALAAVFGDACGIYNVATPDAYRRCGYGALVTAQAVLAAVGAGARYAYLQSSPMGYRVYERLGFVTVERWRQWMLPAYVS